MDAFRRSFMPADSYKQRAVDFEHLEEQPILSRRLSSPGGGGNEGYAGGPSTASSFRRRKEGAAAAAAADFCSQRQSCEDPASKLIEEFLRKQKANGGDVALDMDMDMEMEELRKPSTSSKESPVPPQNPFTEMLRRRLPSFSDSDGRSERKNPIAPPSSRNLTGGAADAGGDEVLKCSSNLSIHRVSGRLRTNTRSRLMDPPQLPSVTPKNRSEMVSNAERLGKSSHQCGEDVDDDDDDPFLDENIPEEFKRSKVNSLGMIQWASLFLVIVALICSLTIPVLQRQTFWDLRLWKWELLALVLLCGRLVSGWGVRIVVFFFERNFFLRMRVLYFVYGVRKAVQNCLWLGLVLVAWKYIIDQKAEVETRSKVLPYVSKILVCLLVATLLRLVKTFVVKVLASSFHMRTYFDRIQEALFHQYVIQTLSGPRSIDLRGLREEDEEQQVVAEMQKLQMAGVAIPAELKRATMASERGEANWSSSEPAVGGGKKRTAPGAGLKKGFSRQQSAGIAMERLHRLSQKNVSAWGLKKLMNIVRHGSLSTLDEQISGASGEDESIVQILTEYQAKAAAKKIFDNVAKPGSKHIYLEDLMCFMGEDEALKAMGLFEGALQSNRVSRRSLKNWVINAFRERRALSLTLNDTKTAVKRLHQMVNVVMAVVIFVLWLLIMDLATVHLLVLVSSQLLLLVFVFGNTLRMVFEDLIFLFGMHPFDVGDRCEVDGVQMIVEEMNILTTVFLRYDNQKIAYPNSVLLTKPISNFYRSPDMWDFVDFCIDVATPEEKVALMKERIKAHIEEKEDYWYPNPSVMLRDVEDMNKLKVSIWLQHRMNHQNMVERWTRRELVVQAMIKVFRELQIEYRMLPLDVSVRNIPPPSSSRLPSTWSTCG
ncbi:unnamed protein product [Spirodela intermedia]|uniref:Mechanosensitive ion channel protein n=1 Tax=Spirodela intermedia TaxID=51605 RepID=A0A7I8K353_SPIIN|nr:unnamed protein product [Spirodela intermedia]